MAWSAFRKMPLWRCCDFQEWFDPDRWVCLHLDNTSWTELTSPPSKHLAGHLIHAMCAMWNRISQIWSFFSSLSCTGWHGSITKCQAYCHQIVAFWSHGDFARRVQNDVPKRLKTQQFTQYRENIMRILYILWIKWYLDCAKLLCTHISSTLNSFVFAPFWAICSWDISNRLWSWPAHLMIGALYSPSTLQQDRFVKPF